MVSDEIKELDPAKTRMIPLFASKELERLKKENAGQIIQDQKTKLLMLKNNLETNPAYHTWEYVEDGIENKLEDLKVSFIQSLKWREYRSSRKRTRNNLRICYIQ